MDIFSEKLLYRILEGRLKYVSGDLCIFIHEPNNQVLLESIEIYEETYNKAYLYGCYIKEEIQDILIKNDIWTPAHDKEADKIDKEIEKLKVECYKNFFDVKKLASLKRSLRAREKETWGLRAKKNTLDHFTCEGVASYCRWLWVIQECSKDQYGNKPTNTVAIMNYYEEHDISPTQIREIARNEPWRSMWSCQKKTHTPLFSCSPTKDQITLASYSGMYDNVREHPECPDDKIIDDDDCLDGWFIDQHNKQDGEKKKENLIGNEKIRNSKEIFLMADDAETAESIYNMNTPFSRGTILQRQEVIGDKKVRDIDFIDIKQDLEIQGMQAMKSHIRGK